MPMLNYGERAKFKNGTDKPFVYRGGLKELLLPAFANGPLHTQFPLQLFPSSTILSCLSSLWRRPSQEDPRGNVPWAECLRRHGPAAAAALPFEQEADAGARVTAPARLGALCKALAEHLTSRRLNSYKGSC